jgi:hypothetical protein
METQLGKAGTGPSRLAMSRRPRIEEVPAGVVFRLALVVLEAQGNVEHCKRLLESAARRSCNDAQWLLGVLRAGGELPEVPNDPSAFAWMSRFARVKACKKWLGGLLASDDSPRAKFLLARTIVLDDYEKWGELVREAAETSYPAAMAIWGDEQISDGDDVDGGLAMLERAIELGDSEACYRLGLRLSSGEGPEIDNQRAAVLLHQAATLGIPEAGYVLLERYRDQLSCVEVATVEAQGYVYQMGSGGSVHALQEHGEDVQVQYAVGRELDGVEDGGLWDFGVRIQPEGLQRCCVVYNAIVGRARQAALQTVAAMQRIVSRDVAVLIAQDVYSTRHNVMLWHASTSSTEIESHAKRASSSNVLDGWIEPPAKRSTSESATKDE